MLQAGFRSPSQLGSVARLLGCLSWQHQVLQRAGIQSSCCTPNGSVADGDHTFVGAYTPVTKQLWLDRLRMAQQQQQHEQPPAGEAAVGRKPQVTRVDYPFTKDRFLLEMVRPWKTTILAVNGQHRFQCLGLLDLARVQQRRGCSVSY